MSSYADALAYLDTHSNYDVTGRITSPTLERMQALPGWAHPYVLMPGHPMPGR